MIILSGKSQKGITSQGKEYRYVEYDLPGSIGGSGRDVHRELDVDRKLYSGSFSGVFEFEHEQWRVE